MAFLSNLMVRQNRVERLVSQSVARDSSGEPCETMRVARGLLAVGGYVPYHRLERSSVREFFEAGLKRAGADGAESGSGERPAGTKQDSRDVSKEMTSHLYRAVASYDEDTTTMGVEAAREALRRYGDRNCRWDAIWFSSCNPAYLDKTNATAIHSSLRLPREVAAYDFGGGLRSGVGMLKAALRTTETTLVVASDMRYALPRSGDEIFGGDGAAALVVGEGVVYGDGGVDGDDGDVGEPRRERDELLAEFLGGASSTEEFVDRWREPGDRRSREWEARFSEDRYVELGGEAYARALEDAGIADGEVDVVAITGMNARASRSLGNRLMRGGTVDDRVGSVAVADDLSSRTGQCGSAHPLLLLAHLVESESGANGDGEAEGGKPAKVIVVVHLADGADALVFKTTEVARTNRVDRSIADQVGSCADISYAKFLSWRGSITTEPPRRPEPQRVSATAAWRSDAWKFGLVGSSDRGSGAIHLPPSRVSMLGGAFDEMDPIAMSGSVGTIATFTVDHMAYSPDPPVVFAVVDFDIGGRLPVELTDTSPPASAEGGAQGALEPAVAVGDEVEMTFRRLFSADGIHDYFWKARPLRALSGRGDGRD